MGFVSSSVVLFLLVNKNEVHKIFESLLYFFGRVIVGCVIITKKILYECIDTYKHDIKFLFPLSSAPKITTVTKLEIVYAIKGQQEEMKKGEQK